MGNQFLLITITADNSLEEHDENQFSLSRVLPTRQLLSIITKNNVLTEVSMIKHLQKIGNSRGIVLDKPILDLLGVAPDGSFEIKAENGGLFLKPVNTRDAYNKISQKHRKSLDKLAK
jgi:antitoxin component of MazEF toxin-antitoxin module